jgi:hypothetical protein
MRNSESVFPFPLNLLFPPSVGTISITIGLSCILIFLLWRFRKQYWPEILSIAGVFILTFLTGQIAPRFFLEPVIWSLPLVLSRSFHSRLFTYFTYALKFQFLALLPFILFGLYSLGPSLLTDKLRTQVMMQSAHGYAESIWVNDVLPDNARICFASRSRAYLSRTYFPWEYLFLSSMENEKEAMLLDLKLRNQYKIDYLVLPVHGFKAFKKRYGGKLVTAPKKFSYAVRNPFNRTEYEMAIYKMK